MVRIVVAPDKFTGSLTAPQAAAAIASGIRSALPAATIVERPVADGGDGTIDALVAAGWATLPITVTGPTGARVDARIARRDAVAVVELAECCGRLRLPRGQSAPTTATTFGLGEAVLAALRTGVREVVVALGGSASTDGGLGLLDALGVEVCDGARHPLRAPLELRRAAAVDVGGLAPEIHGARLTFACDVTAPLLGATGAARMFAPQKGASPDQVAALEAALTRWAEVLPARDGRRVADVPGAGAAGGVVAGALGVLDGFCRVGVVDGAQFVLDATGFVDDLLDADLLVVGEGSLDAQTLLGKVPAVVARLGRERGCPVGAVVGRLDLDPTSVRSLGIEQVVSLTELAGPEEDPVHDAAVLAQRAGVRLIAIVPPLSGTGAAM